jgi:hypothetical protein
MDDFKLEKKWSFFVCLGMFVLLRLAPRGQFFKLIFEPKEKVGT